MRIHSNLITNLFIRASEFSLFFGGHRLNSNEEGTLTIDVPGEAAEVHPFYNPVNLNNDIALIRLPEPIPISGIIPFAIKTMNN